MPVFRGEVFQTGTFRMADPSSFDGVQQSLESDARLFVDAFRERQCYGDQGAMLNQILSLVAVFIAALGGLIGCVLVLPINGLVISTTNWNSFSELSLRIHDHATTAGLWDGVHRDHGTGRRIPSGSPRREEADRRRAAGDPGAWVEPKRCERRSAASVTPYSPRMLKVRQESPEVLPRS